ncbi:hypothetical protein BDY24DRAFT_376992 [Mrakia frigida]|uniref:uncharacterized protein n=1 Tax=Mrakia frigida TaxID=29902 RepID=UPI003FCC0E78
MTLHFEEPSASHPAPSPAASSSPAPSPSSPPTSCLNCSSSPISYQSPTCRHPSLCNGCAMKQATGGKCKVCGEKFFELQRI